MTEKNYNPQQKENKTMKKQEKAQKVKAEIFKSEKPALAEINTEEKKEEKTNSGAAESEQKERPEIKKPAEKSKKTTAVVNGFDIPVSTKHSMAICRFIKRKKISQAISDLEQVAKIRMPIPMKGEIPHRKGKMMSGRFPQKAAKQFIILLKSLSSNAAYFGIEEPIITEAFSNIGARPFGRRGIRRKRTHIRIVAENKTKDKEKK
jgi:large subunit ribosomal protein L22